jgi:hypothetical protein
MMYITKVVESLAEGRGSSEDDSFCFFDPRARTGEDRMSGQK